MKNRVDIIKPGIPIQLTNSRVVTVRGTGVSTAIMAGIVATMLQANPNITPEEVKRILLETKDANGSVNTARALKAAKNKNSDIGFLL